MHACHVVLLRVTTTASHLRPTSIARTVDLVEHMARRSDPDCCPPETLPKHLFVRAAVMGNGGASRVPDSLGRHERHPDIIPST